MHAERRVEIPVESPLASLPPTAQRVLEGARQAILERGFQRLTLQAIHEYSGENTAAISYYFGGKAGLIEAVVDAMVHDECLALSNQLRELPETERVTKLIDGLRSLSRRTSSFYVFFDVLPNAVRDPGLRSRLVALYKWYFNQQLQWIKAPEDASPDVKASYEGMSSLLSAVVDGLAIQAMISPDDFDIDKAYDVFQAMIERCGDSLPSLGGVSGLTGEQG